VIEAVSFNARGREWDARGNCWRVRVLWWFWGKNPNIQRLHSEYGPRFNRGMPTLTHRRSWRVFLSNRTDADFQVFRLGEIRKHGRRKSIAASIVASACHTIGAGEFDGLRTAQKSKNQIMLGAVDGTKCPIVLIFTLPF
jgi:hypothetical protein